MAKDVSPEANAPVPDKETDTDAGVDTRTQGEVVKPPIKPKYHYFKKLFMPWKWKKKKKSDKFKAVSTVLERKMSTRVSKEQLIEMGLIPPLSADNKGVATGGENPCFEETETSRLGSVSMFVRNLHEDSLAEIAPAERSWVSEVGVIPPPEMFSPTSTKEMFSPSSTKEMFSPTSIKETTLSSKVSVMAVGDGLDLSDPRLEEKLGVLIQAENEQCNERLVDSINPSVEPRQVSGKAPKLLSVVKLALEHDNNKIVLEVNNDNDVNAATDEHIMSGEDEAEVKPCSSSKRKLPRGSTSSQKPPLKDKPSNVNSPKMIEEWKEKKDRIGRSLERRLSTRPSADEMRERNLIPKLSREEKEDVKRRISIKLERRLSIRPTETDLKNRNILRQDSAEESKQKHEETKYILQRKLSIRPSVAELKRRKILNFSEYIEVNQIWCLSLLYFINIFEKVLDCEDYDRTADKPWTRLTPRDKAIIRRELNDFKSSEMEVHQESRHMTRFHKP